MNRKIAFGNGDGYIVNYDVKQKIIDFVYSKLDLSKYRYIMLNIQKLNFLQDNEHYVSPNFKGYNYLIVMVNINDKQYCVAIDRKKLSYHKNQLDMKTVNIIQLQMKASESIFNGSIFDGKLMQSDNKYVFLIQDCLYLMGNKFVEMEMGQKITHLNGVLKNHFYKNTSNDYSTNFDIKLNKLYNYKELTNLISEIIPSSKLSVNGLIFYPKTSGINILHLDKKQEKVNIYNMVVIDNKSYHIIHNFVDFLKNRTYSYEQNNKTKILWLTRTDIPDVYDVSEKETSEKLGIALIPNLKISHLCDGLIGENPVKFNCIFSPKHKKWIPLHLIK
jgi:hypothetical protein